MLAKRIIPCLDVKDNRVVKGVKFINLKDAGDPVEVAKIYDAAGADELVFLDITASFEKRKAFIHLIEAVAKNIFMPFTVGGGISSINDIRNLLNAGADKVSINTTAVKKPALISQASKKFGSQCIVVAIDAKSVQSPESRVQSKKKNTLTTNDQLLTTNNQLLTTNNQRLTTNDQQLTTNNWEVFINGGRTPTGLDAVTWAKKVAKLGAGEILLTSMDCDGTKNGYNLGLTKAITQAVNIPVIASGGAGKLEHFFDVFDKAKADAALAASLFHYGEYSIKQVKDYLRSKKIDLRPA